MLTRKSARQAARACGGQIQRTSEGFIVTMDNKAYVLRAAKLKNLDVIKPTKEAPGVLVYDWKSGKGVCVADAPDWKTARQQIDKFYAF